MINKENIYTKCSQITLLSKERIYANIDAVEYVVKNNIEGDIVEIGVWKGGSILAMILALEELNTTRNIFLYDTFEGMTEPTLKDYELNNNRLAQSVLHEPLYKAYSPLEEVKSNIFNNITKEHSISFIKGDICQNKTFPNKIAVLRLDTDWYESTKYELENFYPLVSKNGVIIIDDYGHWAGSRLATDEFINGKNIDLKEIDYTGRLFIKP